MSYSWELWGLRIRRLPTCLWVVVQSFEALATLEESIARLMGQRPGVALALSAAGRDGRRRLKARFRSDVVVAWPREKALGLALRSLRPAAVLIVGRGRAGERLAARLRRRRILVAEAGEGDESVVAGLSDALPVLKGSQRKIREAARGESRLRTAWRHSLPNLVAKLFAPPSLSSWEQLAERLGQPATILCLGNGPSSESSELLQERYDCLLRVNHRWTERGFLTAPDLVVVGSSETSLRVDAAVFAYRTRPQARYGYWLRLTRQRRRRFEHIVLREIDPEVEGADFGARPTHGAYMLAIAVALKPRRLIIAGMDLFQHQAGRYPGDEVGLNAYAAKHERSAEVAFLNWILARYDGELTIHGPTLSSALRSMPV